MLTKEQIKILEEALELLEDYPSSKDEGRITEIYRCAVCCGLIYARGHCKDCKLQSTKLKLDNLIQELIKVNHP